MRPIHILIHKVSKMNTRKQHDTSGRYPDLWGISL